MSDGNQKDLSPNRDVSFLLDVQLCVLKEKIKHFNSILAKNFNFKTSHAQILFQIKETFCMLYVLYCV